MSRTACIEIDARLCKACGICVGMCPQKVFSRDRDGRPVKDRPERCVVCGLCELECPDFAIRVTEVA